MNSVLCKQKRTTLPIQTELNKNTISLKDLRILIYKQVMQNKQNYIKRLTYILMEMIIFNFKKEFTKKQKQQYYCKENQNLNEWVKSFLQKGMKEKIQQHNKQNYQIQIQTLKLKLKTCEKQKQIKLQKCHQSKQLAMKNQQLKVKNQQFQIRNQELNKINKQVNAKYQVQKKNSSQILRKYQQLYQKSKGEIKQLQLLIQKLKQKLIKYKQKDTANCQKIKNLNNLAYQKELKQEEISQLKQLLKINCKKTQKLQHKLNELKQENMQNQVKQQNLYKSNISLNLQINTYKQKLFQKKRLIKQLIQTVQLYRTQTKNIEAKLKNQQLANQTFKNQNKTLELRYIGIQQIIKNSQFRHQSQSYLKNKQNNQILMQYYCLTHELKRQKLKMESFQKKLQQVYQFNDELTRQLNFISQQKLNLIHQIQQLNKYIAKNQHQKQQKKRVSYESKSTSCKNNKYQRNDRISTSPSGKIFPYQHEIQSFDQQFDEDFQQFNLIKQVQLQQNDSSRKNMNNFKFQTVLNYHIVLQQGKTFVSKKVELSSCQIQTDFLIQQYFELEQQSFYLKCQKQQQKNQKTKSKQQQSQKQSIECFSQQILQKQKEDCLQNFKIKQLTKQNSDFKTSFQSSQKQVQTLQSQLVNIQNQEQQESYTSSSDQEYEERDSFTQTKQFYFKDKNRMKLLQQDIFILNKEKHKFEEEIFNLTNSLKKVLQSQTNLKYLNTQLYIQNQNMKIELKLMSQKLKQQQQNNQIIYQEIFTQQNHRYLQLPNNLQKQETIFQKQNQQSQKAILCLQTQIKNTYIKKQIVSKYFKEFLDKQSPWQKRISALDTLSITLDSDQKLVKLIKQYKKWQIAKQNCQKQDRDDQFAQKKAQENQEFSFKFMKFLTQQEQ